MSDTTGGSALAQRWRTFYDVLLGVVLFMSLLLPAIRQASTGTLPGLRNALLLLLLDVVVLVMLSRFITSPERRARLSRAGIPPAPPAAVETMPEPVLTTAEAAALLDDRGAPADVPGLRFTETGISVRQGTEVTEYAELAWSDCAAVVSSRLEVPGGPTLPYLHFVAVHEERIRRGAGDQRSRALAKALGLTDTAGAMVWVGPPQLVRVLPLVLEYVEQHHPRVRIVRPDVLEDAD